MSADQVSGHRAAARTPDREPQTDTPAAQTTSDPTAPEHEGRSMNTFPSATPSTVGSSRPPDGPSRPVGSLRRLSDRELVELAERHDAAGDQAALDTVRAEAERRAHDQRPDSLAAQVAGYVSLLTEDPEHALADEARTWSDDLHRALPAHAPGEKPRVAPDGEIDADPAGAGSALPLPRAHRDSAVRS